MLKHLITLVALATIFSCCNRENPAPVIISLSAEQDSVFLGDTVTLSFEYTDEGSLVNHFEWSCGYGVFINPSDPQVKTIDWIAPKDTGEYNIVLSVDDEVSFTRDSILVFVMDKNSGFFIDPRDQYMYKWKKIGQQTWMAENLAYLPDLEEMLPISYRTPYYYVIGYDGRVTSEARNTQNYFKYGVLYNLPAVNDSLCPNGWHLPTVLEWRSLIQFVGDNSAEKLRAQDGWGEENEDLQVYRSGFDALPTGYWNFASSPGGSSYNRLVKQFELAYFWSSEGNPAFRIEKSSSEAIENEGSLTYQGVSIRCIRDD